MKRVLRFAPSPTGSLHLGAARTALFGWLYANQDSGKFILRIEDTDKKREVPDALANIKESLQWLGLNWQEEYQQSQRLDLYREHAEVLVDKGLAYADPYSPAEVEKFRNQAKSNGQPYLFRNFRPTDPPTWDGSQPLRLKITEPKSYHWQDVVRGQLKAGAEAVDDFILIKSDGYPTYNFAHVVDDHLMKVSHVLRGEEFIASMPNFLALHEAFGWTPPVFATVPAILGKEGRKKLSKRAGDVAVMDYKKAGYIPEALVNYLAQLGWHEGQGSTQEYYTLEELKQKFSLERIQKSPAVFDIDRLNWLNAQHLRRLPPSEFQKRAKEFLSAEFAGLPAGKLRDNLQLAHERVTTLRELAQLPDYIIKAPTLSQQTLQQMSDQFSKAVPELSLGGWLTEATKIIKSSAEDAEKLQAVLGERIKALDGKARPALWSVLRIVLTDSDKTPPIGELVIKEIGKDESVKRLAAALKII